MSASCLQPKIINTISVLIIFASTQTCTTESSFDEVYRQEQSPACGTESVRGKEQKADCLCAERAAGQCQHDQGRPVHSSGRTLCALAALSAAKDKTPNQTELKPNGTQTKRNSNRTELEPNRTQIQQNSNQTEEKARKLRSLRPDTTEAKAAREEAGR